MNQYQDTLKKLGYFIADLSYQEKLEFIKKIGYKDSIEDLTSTYKPEEIKEIIDTMITKYSNENQDYNDSKINLKKKTRLPYMIKDDVLIVKNRERLIIPTWRQKNKLRPIKKRYSATRYKTK